MNLVGIIEKKGEIHLWERKNKSDKVFYELLCIKYFNQIYYYCKSLVKGQEQFIDFVEECTQDTFLAA